MSAAALALALVVTAASDGALSTLSTSSTSSTTTTPADAPPTDAPAAASDATPRRKLLVLDVKGAELKPDEAATLTALLTARAARFAALDVMSTADLLELTALAADKAAVGCDEDASSCLAELAGAIGAQWVLSSRAGKLDGNFVVTLSLFDVDKASAQARASVQAWSLAELPAKLEPAVDDMLARATGAGVDHGDAVPAAAAATPADDGTRSALLFGGGVGAAVGVVAVALGAVPAFIYGGKKQDLVLLTNGFTGEPAQRERAAQLHGEAVDARDLYNGAGRWAVLGGGLLVVAGAGAIAATFFLPGGAAAAEAP